MTTKYQVYPNQRERSHCDEATRGAVRVGMIVENDDTLAKGLAGYVAAVTHEDVMWARCYVFTTTEDTYKFPNNPLWIGPYTVHPEEIVTEGEL